MKISVTVNESDYIKLNEYYAFHSRQGKKSLAVMRWTAPVCAIVFIVFFAIRGISRELFIVEIVGLTIFAAVRFFSVSKRFRKDIEKNVKKLKREGKLPYTEEAILEFCDDVFIETTENSVKKIHYSDVNRIGSTDEHIFIFFDAVQAVIIPKRCVAEVQAELEMLLNQKCIGVQK